MSTEQITIIPNTNTSLHKAKLIETIDGGFDLYLMPIVAWAVRVDSRHVDGSLIYHTDAIDSDEGGHEDEDDYAVINIHNDDWHVPYQSSGKGKQSLIDCLRGNSAEPRP